MLMFFIMISQYWSKFPNTCLDELNRHEKLAAHQNIIKKKKVKCSVKNFNFDSEILEKKW
jgi:hypothetical protein